MKELEVERQMFPDLEEQKAASGELLKDDEGRS